MAMTFSDGTLFIRSDDETWTDRPDALDVLLALQGAPKEEQVSTVFDIMPQIMEWLAANNIEPTDLPVSAVPVVVDRQITCTVFRRNANGNKYLGDDGMVARTTVTVPLLVEPPEVLQPWLAGSLGLVQAVPAGGIEAS